jgi:ATP-dependent DNA helicase RecG
LKQLAQPVASKGKVDEKVMRATILALCSGRFLTLEQISQLLDRNTTAVRFRFVKNLVAEGFLRLRYPNSPNHPNQAYIAVIPMRKTSDLDSMNDN